MNNKSLGAVLAVVGLIAVVVGLALMLVIVPGMKVFPADVDVVRNFDVAYLTLLDAETLEFAVFPEGEEHDLRIERHIRVEAVDGNNTLVREEQMIYNGEDVLIQQVKHYALDRHEMTPVTDFPAEWAENDGYWPREGQVIGWPIGAEARDYVGWSDDTRATVTLEYVDEREHSGVNTYYYTSASGPDPIAPEHAVVLGLPESLTVTQVARLAAGIESDEVELSTPGRLKLVRTIGQAVEDVTGGSDIPLEYVYDYVGEYWADPTTGVLLDATKMEHRAVNFPQEIRDRFEEILTAEEQDPESSDYVPPEILDIILPITVNTFYYDMTPESTQDAIDEANASATTINLFGTTIPTILLIAGVLLAGVGGFMFSRPATKA